MKNIAKGFTNRVAELIIVVKDNMRIPLEKESPPMDGNPRPIVIVMAPDGSEASGEIVAPPQSCSMRVGYVCLQPRTSTGEHSSENLEESIILLDGNGELALADGSCFALSPKTVAYIPPQTVHAIRCTGDKPLRYYYVAAGSIANESQRESKGLG